MKPITPPRVDNVEAYWGQLPEQPSERLKFWIKQVENGWLPNRRISTMGYYESAEFYGIYIEEYLTILSPIIRGYRERRDRALFNLTSSED